MAKPKEKPKEKPKSANRESKPKRKINQRPSRKRRRKSELAYEFLDRKNKWDERIKLDEKADKIEVAVELSREYEKLRQVLSEANRREFEMRISKKLPDQVSYFFS